MLLTLRTTHVPATDLGLLLGQDTGRVQSFELGSGRVHLLFPEVSETACTAAFLLEAEGYVSPHLLVEAIGRVLVPALAESEAALPLEARVAALPCRGGEPLLHRTFEPLGYSVAAERHPLDPELPELGPSPYFTVTLRRACRVRDLLADLTRCVPVLSGEGGT